MQCRVSIIEDDPETRESVSAVLRRSSGIEFLRAYASAEEAISQLPQDPPDVALMDISLPGISGIECVQTLKSKLPKVEFLVLTTYEDSNAIFQSLRAGASGYLLKRASSAELLEAIQTVR